jgi:hypothetical protein
MQTNDRLPLAFGPGHVLGHPHLSDPGSLFEDMSTDACLDGFVDNFSPDWEEAWIDLGGEG